ncbi:MAG: glycosyltransferase [Clostridiales Family XIII bacterium]|nr:glycosyltransferase [Clostridiales Family XIII bacterium]
MGTETADISVIVPIYMINENYLRTCIESLIAVKDTPVEVILVDDGSPDNCGEICDEYAGRDDRIRVIHQVNMGVSAARNNGMAAAKGKWLCFVDADDWVEWDYYEMLAPYTQSLCDVIMFGCYMNNKKVHSEELKTLLQTVSYEDLCWRWVLLNKYKVSGQICAQCYKLFSREFIAKHKIRFEPGLWMREDGMFMLDVFIKSPKMDHFDVYYYHYRIHMLSVCRSYNPDIFEWANAYKTYIYKRISLYTPYESKKNELNFDILTLSLLQSECNRIYFFHIDNTKSYKLRRDEFLEHITESQMKKAIKNVKVRELRCPHTFILLLIKLRWFFMLNFMYKVRYWLAH